MRIFLKIFLKLWKEEQKNETNSRKVLYGTLILFMAFYIKGMIQKEMDDVKNSSIQSVLPI